MSRAVGIFVMVMIFAGLLRSPVANGQVASAPPSGGSARVLLGRALEELQAGRNSAAIATAEQGLAEFGRPIPTQLDDPLQINLYHVQAVALGRSGQVPRGGQMMDRVRAATKTNLSVAVNDALLDLQFRPNLPRAAESLRKLVLGGDLSPALEEPLINAFGYAISTHGGFSGDPCPGTTPLARLPHGGGPAEGARRNAAMGQQVDSPE